MSDPASTKPYLIRALHEWCVDNGLTPHLLVAVDAQTRVPAAYVKDGEIVLNVNYSATRDLQIGNNEITFSARFGGVSNNLFIPVSAVRGIFARENGQGMFFQPEEPSDADPAAESEPVAEPPTPAGGGKKNGVEKKKPFLKLVK